MMWNESHCHRGRNESEPFAVRRGGGGGHWDRHRVGWKEVDGKRISIDQGGSWVLSVSFSSVADADADAAEKPRWWTAFAHAAP